MRLGQCTVLFLTVVVIASFPHRVVSQASALWPPISKEELELKDNSLEPGKPAMILYREVQTDNKKSSETHFTRIKVFNDLGKKYADVEVPYLENQTEV